MKYSKLSAQERKVWSNEMCKVRQKERIGYNKNFTPMERDLIEYMELFEGN